MNKDSEPLNPVKILIVDDERIQRMILSETLKNQGYRIFEADSGERGLEQ